VTQAELLRYLVETLQELGIEYMITGSQASIYYGEPRFTQDIDVVVEVTLAHGPGLLARFPEPEFYLSEHAMREAIEVRGQFNVIHADSGLKIDLIVRKDTEHARAEFERRERHPLLPGTDAAFARPEDVILSKLASVQQGGSERHLRDVAGMLRVSREQIDARYIDAWARRLALSDLWEAVRRRAADGEGGGGS
jgi:hypothetical protein